MAAVIGIIVLLTLCLLGALVAIKSLSMLSYYKPTLPEPPHPGGPYGEGFDAGLEGDTIDQNPYPANTAEHTAWIEGWLESEGPAP